MCRSKCLWLCDFFSDKASASNLFPLPSRSHPVLPGPSENRSLPVSPPDPIRVARSSLLLTKLFPDFSQIFLHTLLESRNFDLLSTLETLLDLQYRPYPGVVPVTLYSGNIHVPPSIRSHYLTIIRRRRSDYR